MEIQSSLLSKSIPKNVHLKAVYDTYTAVIMIID
jgi:hypothetical protein